MAIDIQPHAEGSLLAVKAQPGSRASGLRGQRAGALCVAVTEVAERGKANAAVVAVLARELAVRRGQIELVRGQTSAAKRFLIRGCTPTQLAAKIEQALAKIE
ncbi:MAG TPA: DUF167 domain-containing protein [Pirellulales bacterium]|nr:DUF167 domain-containing protein [Pirellulales bacterium]